MRTAFVRSERIITRIEKLQSGRSQATGVPAGSGDIRLPRGDHDLNPDFYDPQRRLKPAAVLIPIIERRPEPTVLFTRRTDHLAVHPGQISFPGGRLEPLDSGHEAAALRETEEEVGLPGQKVRLIGTLDTYITRTGYEIAPLVGLVAPPFPISPDPFEVAEVFEVPLGYFLAAGNRELCSRRFEGRDRHFYAFSYQGYFIWGATAGILVNLADVLADSKLGV
jgi:8-oxo-dGTP pyrophosphatase MutT (NUDIX family)